MYRRIQELSLRHSKLVDNPFYHLSDIHSFFNKDMLNGLILIWTRTLVPIGPTVTHLRLRDHWALSGILLGIANDTDGAGRGNKISAGYHIQLQKQQQKPLLRSVFLTIRQIPHKLSGRATIMNAGSIQTCLSGVTGPGPTLTGLQQRLW